MGGRAAHVSYPQRVSAPTPSRGGGGGGIWYALNNVDYRYKRFLLLPFLKYGMSTLSSVWWGGGGGGV